MKLIKYIAIIPARKGSKRLKKKNLRKIKKKTLFQLTLQAALKCNKISKIIISSDIKSILKNKNKKIFNISRPKYLCMDKCSTESAMFHAIKLFQEKDNTEIKNIILLQPTSPLRSSGDINNAIKVFEKKNCDSLLSAYKQKLCLWKKTNKYFKSKNYNVSNYKNIGGQFQPIEILENGAIYIFKLKYFYKYKNRLFRKIGISFMSKENSVEIDRIEDLKIAKAISIQKKIN